MPDPGLSRDVTELSTLLHDSEDLESALHQVAELVVRVVPGCAAAGVVLADPTGPRTLAATDERSWSVATYQYDNREGPGVEAIRYGEPRRSDDTSREDRWPGFTAEAARLGLRSALALPLRMAGTTSGALSLYGGEVAAFDGMPQDIAILLAGRSALALSNADLYFGARRLAENLHEALGSRAVIEQAKGVVMAREHCGPDEAFDILRGVSQRGHEKLRRVAERVVATTDDGATKRP